MERTPKRDSPLKRCEQGFADDGPAPSAEDGQFALAAQERGEIAAGCQHFRLDPEFGRDLEQTLLKDAAKSR